MPKCMSGRASPRTALEAHDAFPDPLVGWGENTSLNTLPHTAPSALTLGASISGDIVFQIFFSRTVPVKVCCKTFINIK